MVRSTALCYRYSYHGQSRERFKQLPVLHHHCERKLVRSSEYFYTSFFSTFFQVHCALADHAFFSFFPLFFAKVAKEVGRAARRVWQGGVVHKIEAEGQSTGVLKAKSGYS